MTYSIVARDPATGELGVAVQTHQPAVGSIVPWVKAGVGAVATQSFANINFGPQGLSLLESGLTAQRALAAIIAGDDMPARRQVAIIAAEGDPAIHTGDQCIPFAGHRTGEHYSVQANMMTKDTVPAAMMDAFERATGELAERMLAALDAAQAEGGDIRGSQSAALLIRAPGPLNARWDLRVDNSRQPLAELRRLVELRLLGGALRPAAEGGVSSAEFVAQLERAAPLSPPDEEQFWFALQALSGRANDVPAAAAVLEPIFARAPQWKDLLHRLETPEAEALKARFPAVNICVFCSASDGVDPVYFAAADELGASLALRHHALIYGGASIGLMGAIGRSTHDAGGRVVGVIPQSLVDREITYRAADEVIVTTDLRDRKRVLEDRSDAFIVLPGGFGTLEEMIELLTLKQLALHAKPIVIVNIAGFYDPLIHLFAHIERHGFAPLGGNALYTVVDTIEAAIAAVEREAVATPGTATRTPS